MLRCLRLGYGGFGVDQDLFELCRPLVLERFINVVQLTQQVRPAHAVHHVVKVEVRFPMVMDGTPLEAGRIMTAVMASCPRLVWVV